MWRSVLDRLKAWLTANPEWFAKTPDGSRRAYCVVLASFLNYMVIGSHTRLPGVLYPILLDAFHSGIEVMAVVIAFLCSVPYIMSLFIGPLTRMVGPRHLAMVGVLLTCAGYLTSSFANSLALFTVLYGVLTGLGVMTSYMSAFMCMQVCFNRKRSTANGLVQTGLGVGILISPLLYEHMNEVYGWRGAMLVFGGLLLHGFPVAVLLPKNTYSTTQSEQEGTSDTKSCTNVKLCSILLQKATFLYSVTYFGMSFAHATLVSLLPMRAEEVGISAIRGASLISFIGAADILTRFFVGPIGERGPQARILLCVTGTFVFGLCTIVAGLLRSYVFFLLPCIIAGLAFGAATALMFVSCVDIYGIDHVGVGSGFMLFTWGLGSFIAPVLLGWVASVLGSFEMCFYIGGTTACVCSAFALPLVWKKYDYQIL